MESDIRNLTADLRTLVPDIASLSVRPLDVSIRLEDATVSVAEVSAGISNQNMVTELASKMTTTFEDSVARASLEIPSANAIENVRPAWESAQRATVLNSPLVQSFAKLHSSAVAAETVKAASIFNGASIWGQIAGGLQGLGTLAYQAKYWQSVGPFNKQNWLQGWQDVTSGGAVRKLLLAGMQRTACEVATRAVQNHAQPYIPLATALGFLGSPALTRLADFSPRVADVSQMISGWFEHWSYPLASAFECLRQEMERWPLDPYGERVPIWNVSLYQLAQQAYEAACGVDAEEGYVACALFLDQIGADKNSADNVLLIRELLKPTFDPQRLDRRVDWEQMGPADARRWLRRRLKDLQTSYEREGYVLDKCELTYDEADLGVVRIAPSTPSALKEFMRQERERTMPGQLLAMLPERQCQVLWCIAEGMTYEETAYCLGIGVSTVKTHARRLRENGDLKALLSWQSVG